MLVTFLLISLFWDACICSDLDDGRLTSDGLRFRRFVSTLGGALENINCSAVISPVPRDVVSRYRLRETFYKKYISVYGIPIMGSDLVDDRALQRACYTVRFMLAGSEILRQEMRTNKARVAIIAPTEKLYTVPEYSRLSRRAAWRNRRGVGGTFRTRITVGAQENLLCEKGDAYGPNADILIHELAHMIHLVACYTGYPYFNQRLMLAYNNAMKNKLWQNTYSAMNHKEYFAMGVQSYLNQQSEGPVGGNHVYNNINTRAELMNYDKDLYDLIREVITCDNDYIPRCTDVDQIRSPPQVLTMDCPRTLPDRNLYPCQDSAGQYCQSLRSRCHSQPYVIENCVKSCGRC